MAIPSSAARFTLRETSATPFLLRAAELRKPVIDATIGDPAHFGLFPFPPFLEELSRAVCQRELHGYPRPSLGLPELREAIARQWVGHPDAQVYLGNGVSGIVRDLFQVLAGPGASIVVPAYSYILYLFHSELHGLPVVTVSLEPDGQLDLASLGQAISDPNIRLAVIVTTGNPFGVSIEAGRLESAMKMVAERERVLHRPIHLIVDVIYEPLRRGGGTLDPISIARQAGRLGPTLVVDSLSKVRIVAPGDRLGWAAVEWPSGSFDRERQEFSRSLTTLQQPSLGTIPPYLQHALLATLHGIESDPEPFRRFTEQHIAEVRRRMDATFADLDARRDRLLFPSCYYETPDDPSSALRRDPVSNSLYHSFGVQRTARSEEPLGAQLARFTLENGRSVLGTVPLAAFVAPELAAQAHPFTRMLGLLGGESRSAFFRELDKFLDFQDPSSSSRY